MAQLDFEGRAQDNGTVQLCCLIFEGWLSSMDVGWCFFIVDYDIDVS